MWFATPLYQLIQLRVKFVANQGFLSFSDFGSPSTRFAAIGWQPKPYMLSTTLLTPHTLDFFSPFYFPLSPGLCRRGLFETVTDTTA